MGETVSDEVLMTRYCVGQIDAFDQLYTRHKTPVFRYLLRQTRRVARAEELHQDVWLAMINSRASYQPIAAFRTWLFTIARSKLIDHFRRERGFVVVSTSSEDGHDIMEGVADGQPGTEESVHSQDCLELLRAEVERLPDVQRQAFVMHEEGLSIAQIGEVMQTAAETAKSRVGYAKDALREKLADCL